MPRSVGSPRRQSPSSSGRRSSFRLTPRISSHSPHRHTPPSTPRRRWIPSEQLLNDETLPKCSSEPLLPGTFGGRREVEVSSSVPDEWLLRQLSFSDVFAPPNHLLSSESIQTPNEGYQKDAKVVVAVTVEGSSGPIRTMVKLGSTVEETIKLVIEKYGAEGRSPRLDNTSASAYDLHVSYFSLESLDRQEAIGSSGSRNFYLRKGRSLPDQNSLLVTEIVPAPAPESYLLQPTPPVVFIHAYITRKLTKIMRRMRKVWKVIGCLH